MTIPSDALISLDTNILVHWVRQNDIGQYLKEEYKLQDRIDRPLYSTVVEGELKALARIWKWGTAKLEILDSLLEQLVRLDSGIPEVVEAYSELHAADKTSGHNTGQNDLWIAAASKAAGAILLTCDDDCLWMAPSIVKVEYVSIKN